MAELGPPGVKSTRAWVWDDLRGTRNLLAALAGLEEACNSERGGGGGSARWNMPASACASSSGHGNGCVRVCVHAQGQSNAKQVGAMLYRAAGARPWWSAGNGVPASGLAYGPLHLAQKER